MWDTYTFDRLIVIVQRILQLQWLLLLIADLIELYENMNMVMVREGGFEMKHSQSVGSQLQSIAISISVPLMSD